MARETLADFFDDLAASRGEFLVHDDGLRTRRHTYREVADAARAFAGRLQAHGVVRGDKVLFWSENRPEWIAALWGCLIAGVVVVPLDYRSSPGFARRVATIVRARVALVGEDVPIEGGTDAVSAALGGVDVWPLARFDWQGQGRFDRPPIAADDLAEIIFTSGATADPKGVLITHRNLLANIVPIEREVMKYRSWGRPFFPLRFLDLLPLSHLFGQAMATFIPPMLPGTVIFMRGYNPADIVEQIRKRRVSVTVAVPKILDVLGEHVRARFPGAGHAGKPGPHEHVALRWWRYRAVHRAFGLKFWSFVVGAAPLDPATEGFWSRLGFLVIQGYGLTETAPIVTLNHPFSARKGSVGKPIPGVEVKLAPDGEILVRGENVTRGYFESPDEQGGAFEDGWLHTGDIGELDANGQLFVKGRKKEMIVTPEGMNVFPEDVERVLNEQAGVRDSAVVGLAAGGEERVHAVLVLDEGADASQVIRDANARLADHQKVRGVSVWPKGELPRTEGTRKLKRREIRQWAQTGARSAPVGAEGRPLEAVLARFASGREVRPETTIEELGLSSLDRVELMVALDERFQAHVDEARFAEARTVADIRSLLAAPPEPAQSAGRADDEWRMPAWSRAKLVSAVRRASLTTWVLPLARLFARLSVQGLEHLEKIDGPVVFAANHQSHLDTPVIMAALPGRVRGRLAVAMAKEFFDPKFHSGQYSLPARARSSVLYVLAAFFFNAFPLPQREAGARQTLRYIGDLLSDGWSVLIYPEGQRTDAGEIRPFRPGVGMIGARLGVPVVPVRLEGVDRVLHKSWRMAKPGRVRVAFGPPLTLSGESYAELAGMVEKAVRGL